MASKRAKDIQMGKPAKPAKLNIAKRAMLMKRPPPSDAEVMEREEEVKETKMAAFDEATQNEDVHHDHHAPPSRDDDGGAHHDHEVARIHMPRVPASPTNVSFSLQDFFRLVHDMLEHDYYPYHVFADPLDMTDYPGTVYFRHKNWELEPPVGHNLSSIALQIRDLLSAAEPCGPTQLSSGDGDNAGDIPTRRPKKPRITSKPPPAAMDTGVEMRSTDLHEAAAGAPPEMPGRPKKPRIIFKPPPAAMDTGVEMRFTDLHEAAADAPPEMPGRPMKALVVCDCGACHSKQRFVNMRARSRHRKIFKRIVAPPTLPEEAPEDDDDDDEQFSDGDNDGEESDDHGEEFDKQDHTHSDADEQEDMDDAELLGEELIQRVTDDIERKLQSVGNMDDMEVMFIV
eukprot:gene1716-2376_t